jgi:hypothetical protein
VSCRQPPADLANRQLCLREHERKYGQDNEHIRGQYQAASRLGVLGLRSNRVDGQSALYITDGPADRPGIDVGTAV